jgi:nitrogen fixation protein FixH
LIEFGFVDQQLDRLLAVDLDYRNPLQIRTVERFIGLDIALDQDELMTLARAEQQLSGVVAQATAVAAVQHNRSHAATGARSPLA